MLFADHRVSPVSETRGPELALQTWRSRQSLRSVSSKNDIRQFGQRGDLCVGRSWDVLWRLVGAVAPQDVEAEGFRGVGIPAIRREEANALGGHVEALAG